MVYDSIFPIWTNLEACRVLCHQKYTADMSRSANFLSFSHPSAITKHNMKSAAEIRIQLELHRAEQGRQEQEASKEMEDALAALEAEEKGEGWGRQGQAPSRAEQVNDDELVDCWNCTSRGYKCVRSRYLCGIYNGSGFVTDRH
jgi:hypothetical protein